MHILITNHALQKRTGSELYTLELSTALKSRGIDVSVYSPHLGSIASQIQQHSIPVYADLSRMKDTPDLIHGQHYLETMSAIERFRSTPAIFVCHGIAPWQETPPLHPNILRYYGVSALVTAKIIYSGVELRKPVIQVQNWVDVERFQRKNIIRDTPKKALIVSNSTYDIAPITLACRDLGIDLKKIGAGFAYTSENIHEEFLAADIVFAVGRTAIEALATGCCLIPASGDGAAELVNDSNFSQCQSGNFAIGLLSREKFTVEFIKNEIIKYSRDDVAAVCKLVRESQSLTVGINRWMNEYRQCLKAVSSEKQSYKPTSPYGITIKSQLYRTRQELRNLAIIIKSISSARIKKILFRSKR